MKICRKNAWTLFYNCANKHQKCFFATVFFLADKCNIASWNETIIKNEIWAELRPNLFVKENCFLLQWKHWLTRTIQTFHLENYFSSAPIPNKVYFSINVFIKNTFFLLEGKLDRSVARYYCITECFMSRQCKNLQTFNSIWRAFNSKKNKYFSKMFVQTDLILKCF